MKHLHNFKKKTRLTFQEHTRNTRYSVRERNERGREKASQTWKVLGFLVGSKREVSNGEMERKWRAFILYGSATYMQQANAKQAFGNRGKVERRLVVVII